jgi:hypothetical protein
MPMVKIASLARRIAMESKTAGKRIAIAVVPQETIQYLAQIYDAIVAATFAQPSSLLIPVVEMDLATETRDTVIVKKIADNVIRRKSLERPVEMEWTTIAII